MLGNDVRQKTYSFDSVLAALLEYIRNEGGIEKLPDSSGLERVFEIGTKSTLEIDGQFELAEGYSRHVHLLC